jgi:hypothetical protein
MKHSEYAGHTRAFTQEMLDITDAKNADYTAGTDEAMAGFYELGEFAGVSPLQAYLVLLGKHVQAVRRFAKVGNVKSESLHGRFTDISVYGMLGDALVMDMHVKECLDSVLGDISKMAVNSLCETENSSSNEKNASRRKSRTASTATSAVAGTRSRRASQRSATRKRKR